MKWWSRPHTAWGDHGEDRPGPQQNLKHRRLSELFMHKTTPRATQRGIILWYITILKCFIKSPAILFCLFQCHTHLCEERAQYWTWRGWWAPWHQRRCWVCGGLIWGIPLLSLLIHPWNLQHLPSCCTPREQEEASARLPWSEKQEPTDKIVSCSVQSNKKRHI